MARGLGITDMRLAQASVVTWAFPLVIWHPPTDGELNQDGFFHQAFDQEGVTFVAAAFDGHGLLGETAAQHASHCLAAACIERDFTTNFLHDASVSMHALFDRLQAAVLQAHDQAPAEYTYPDRQKQLEFCLMRSAAPGLGRVYRCQNRSGFPDMPVDFGCTVAVAVVLGERLVLGNAGDAGAILCTLNSCGEVEAQLLSTVHAAKENAERERVNKDFPGKAHFTPDGYMAPLDDALGAFEVQITRSLGHDKLRHFGVVSTPDVIEVDLRAAQAFALVLCSDGVTDELQPLDIAQRVFEAPDPLEASQTICADAQLYCMDRDKVDDCTAVVLTFSPWG